MICIQLNSRVILPPGQPLLLQDAARVEGPSSLLQVRLPCPDQEGVWRLEAIDVLRAACLQLPDAQITVLGSDVCYVHRVRASRRDPTRPLRTAAAFLILLLGSALGLAWFHSDVDMPAAQLAMYTAVTGREPSSPLLITIPYVIGVALGVAVFYALPGKGRTTPLEIRLNGYRADMEQAEARSMEESRRHQHEHPS